MRKPKVGDTIVLQCSIDKDTHHEVISVVPFANNGTHQSVQYSVHYMPKCGCGYTTIALGAPGVKEIIPR